MITLVRVTQKDRDLLWNINQKYLYEMTNFYNDPMDEKGNYHYGYFDDYFNFFTLYNPALNEEVHGLCYYGVTKIPFEVLESVIITLKHILGIFEFASDEINLKGNYVCGFAEKPDFTGNYENGYFERLKISKEKFCKKLKDIIILFSKAKDENKCIMHFGI